MTPNELESIVRCGETSLVQFKRELPSQRQIAAEIVAFANTKGGTILFGVQDKTGEAQGLSYDQAQKISMALGNAATEHVRPSVFLTTEAVETDGKLVLAVRIPEGRNKPYKDLNGTIWVKQAADKRRLTENREILGLFQESSLYEPDAEPVRGSGMDDLEVAYVNEYFLEVHGKTKDDFGKPPESLLKSIGVLASSGEATRAGLLFFGKTPQAFLKTFKIKAVAFYGNSIGGTKYRDSRDIEGTIPRMYHEAMAFLKANLARRQGGRSFNSTGELEFPEVVLEELLQNALVHVDLLQPTPIRILVFSDRVEIANPGALFGGLTIDEIKLGVSRQRNPAIANFCSKLLVYRGLGSGIVRTLREGVRIDFYNDIEADQFRVVLWRTDDKPTISPTSGAKTDDKPTISPTSGAKTDDKPTISPTSGIKTDDKPTISPTLGAKTDDKPTINDTEKDILWFLRNNADSSTKEIAKHIGLSITQTKTYLYRLVGLGFLQADGANRNRTYRLKR